MAEGIRAPPPVFGQAQQSTASIVQNQERTMFSPFSYLGSNSSVEGQQHGFTGLIGDGSRVAGDGSELQPNSENVPLGIECAPCGKSFGDTRRYQAHLQQHIRCSFPGCVFSAVRPIVNTHIKQVHTNEQREAKSNRTALKRPASSVSLPETPEEIEKWRAERRKNWPSATNIARKDEERKRQRGQTMSTHQGTSGSRKGQEANSAVEGLDLVASYDSDMDDSAAEDTSNAEEEAKSASMSREAPKSQNRKPCKFFSTTGHCRFMNKCRFNHDRENSRNVRRRKDQRAQPASLLRQLLSSDMRHEHMMLLQCIRYLVLTNHIEA